MGGQKNKARAGDKKGSVDENINNMALADIYKALQEISYGSVQVHIQDGRIIQIDKVNKVRMR